MINGCGALAQALSKMLASITSTLLDKRTFTDRIISVTFNTVIQLTNIRAMIR